MIEDTKRTLNEWRDRIHTWAHRQGFYGTAHSTPCKHLSGNRMSALMLIVTELAEAAEAIRHRDPVNFNEEIADTLIRLLDLCGAEGIDIEIEVARKMQANEKREYKHGKAC